MLSMLSVHYPGSRLCDGLTRREWLHVGGLGVLGLTMPGLSVSRAAPADLGRAFGKAKACIVLFLGGGPPQHETWDPKPDAPAEIRGDLTPIASSVPGLRVGELMPRTAKLAHQVAVLRAVSSTDSAHSSSGYYMLTGYPHQPMQTENARPGAPNDWPSLAAMVRKLRGDRKGLPGSVVLPEHIWNTGGIPWPGQFAGFLGQKADPWLIHCDPNTPDFHVPGLKLPEDVPALRFDDRQTLLAAVNQHLDAIDRSGAPARFTSQSQQAFNLLRGTKARQGFDLDREPPPLRERYGRHRFGQSVLLARRLVEAGVSLVQINWTREKDGTDTSPMWDTHDRNTYWLKKSLMPVMDAAYSTLLEDLESRGLLESTLVVWMGEFGRTPKINGRGGRDHWGHVYSVALAGGGVRGGIVHGMSDSQGGQPKEGRVPPQDLAATIFHCLGYEPHTELHDALGRPVPISRGEAVRQVF
jgi:hypothetical protein